MESTQCVCVCVCMCVDRYLIYNYKVVLDYVLVETTKIIG